VKKKGVKKLLKQHPEFEAWLLKDSSRITAVKANPASAQDLFKRWSMSKRALDFEGITAKTQRAKDMLGNFQSIMDVMSEYAKKQDLF
jgi:hypothetical protein